GGSPRAGNRRHRGHAGRVHHRNLPDPRDLLRCGAPCEHRCARAAPAGNPCSRRGGLMRRHCISVGLVAAIVLQACNVGPKYKKPAVDVPNAYRVPAELSPAEISGASAGDVAWASYFQDPQLQALIEIALKNNYDLRIAATRVLQARASLGITRAD